MNDNADHDDELPELSDEDIEILHDICRRASSSHDPPFKALFAAYDQVFAEQQIEQEHDGVVFRFLLRVGEGARSRTRAGTGVDLVGQLKSILAAHGITVVDDLEDSILSEVAKPVEIPSVVNRLRTRRERRRVSFDDAGLDETWLSERSSYPGQSGLLSMPPRRGREYAFASRQRAQSATGPMNGIREQQDLGHYQQASPSMVSAPEVDQTVNPTLLFEASPTQLEENAEAFLSTTEYRVARQCLQIWYHKVLSIRQTQSQAYKIAESHDRRTLLKQALDQWNAALQSQHEHQRVELYWERVEHRVEEEYKRTTLARAYTHWATSTKDQRLAVGTAQRHMLRYRYFRRWRAIATDNAAKARSLLIRKFLDIWREKLARRLLQREQAEARLEEFRMKRCYKAWFWQFCSRRVEGWHEHRVKMHSFHRLVEARNTLQMSETQAENHYNLRLAQHAVRLFRQRLQQQHQSVQTAQAHRDQTLVARGLRALVVHQRLAPIARFAAQQAAVKLQRKAIKVWQLHFGLVRHAAEVDRKRLLQSAWTSWNDGLRYRAIAQKIDERVIVENLYRWVLQERLQRFVRSQAARLLHGVLQSWAGRVAQRKVMTAAAERKFEEEQLRRRQALAILRLHGAVRRQEDAERTAVEFANSEALAKVLCPWIETTRHVLQLEKWAADGRFYTLTTRALGIWKAKTTERQHNRKRDAYAQVRARIKIRLAGCCLSRLRAHCAKLAAMKQQAEHKAQERRFAVGTSGFDTWREKTSLLIDMNIRASTLDYERLASSALLTLASRHVDLAALDAQAMEFKRESDLALLALALKRLQWQQFTAVRRIESAEALRARNRDSHVRHMVRHWATQVHARRQQRGSYGSRDGEDEPDSPSLRPASRAASRSAQRPVTATSSPGRDSATPAYLKTPSRPRRAGRFRPIPTPAPTTPFHFNPSYLTTTPAPLGTEPLRTLALRPAQDTNAPDEGDLADGFRDDLVHAHGILDDRADGASEILTPQVTPFSRKLRAGGFVSTPAQALRNSVLGRPALSRSTFAAGPPTGGGGTSKSVRFVGNSRFGGGHLKSS